MTDLHWLGASCLLTALLWLPYVLKRIVVQGILGAMSNPNPDAAPITGWAMRAQAAHKNAIENLIVFAPLLLISHSLELSNTTTLFMAQLFFYSRLAHFVVYTWGIPIVRTLAFATGWIATLGIASIIFNKILIF